MFVFRLPYPFPLPIYSLAFRCNPSFLVDNSALLLVACLLIFTLNVHTQFSCLCQIDTFNDRVFNSLLISLFLSSEILAGGRGVVASLSVRCPDDGSELVSIGSELNLPQLTKWKTTFLWCYCYILNNRPLFVVDALSVCHPAFFHWPTVYVLILILTWLTTNNLKNK